MPHNQPIVRKVVVALVLGALIPLLVAVFGATYVARQIITDEVTARLSALADMKMLALKEQVRRNLAEVASVSYTPEVQEAMTAYAQAFADGGVYTQAYQAAERRFRPLLLRYFNALGYYDMFLVSPSGDVVMSVTHENDFGTNLVNGPFSGTGLGTVFHDALAKSGAAISALEFYAPSRDVASFAAAPIVKDGKPLGVAAIQFRREGLYQIVTDHAGLGRTGQTVLGRRDGDDIVIVSPLRDSPDAAFRLRLSGKGEKPAPMWYAVNGQSRSMVAVDGRGIEVLATTRYLPALDVGVVVKMDASEAFSRIDDLNRTSIVLLLATAVVAVVIAYMLSRTLTAPLRRLTYATQAVAAGRYDDVPTEVGSREENILAAAFRTMAHRINATEVELKTNLDQQSALIEELESARAEARENEQRLRLVFNSAADGIITIAPDGIIQSINIAVEGLFGYSAMELVGRNSSILVPDPLKDAARKTLEKFAAATAGAEGARRIETEARRKDGTLFPAELAVSALTDELGNRTVTVIISDISERKRMDNDLREAKERADKANEAKSDFLSSMSHELRTPLNAILGFAQLLEMSKASPQSAQDLEYLSIIRKSGSHLLELINDILDLAKIEAGKIDYSLEPIEIGAALDEILPLIETLADKRGIVVHRPGRHEERLRVVADYTRFKQVLLNLLSNAVKYNRENGTITVDVVRPRPTLIEIGVSDTGTGIPPERRDALFKPFSRLVGADSEIEGTGIGLVIAKRIVESMDGHIGVTSALGKGSRFWIALPLAEGEPPRAAPTDDDGESDEDALLPDFPSLRTILYVEDNPSNIRLMEGVFADAKGYRLVTAHTGELGLAAAEAERPDLVLLDINLPGISGYEVLDRLRRIDACRSVPVIAVSANATGRDIDRGLAHGFDVYLTKPIDIKKLFAAIHRHLR